MLTGDKVRRMLPHGLDCRIIYGYTRRRWGLRRTSQRRARSFLTTQTCWRLQLRLTLCLRRCMPPYTCRLRVLVIPRTQLRHSHLAPIGVILSWTSRSGVGRAPRPCSAAARDTSVRGAPLEEEAVVKWAAQILESIQSKRERGPFLSGAGEVPHPRHPATTSHEPHSSLAGHRS